MILYKLSFNFTNFLRCLIPLAVAVILFICYFKKLQQKNKGAIIFVSIFCSIFLLISLLMSIGFISDYSKKKKYLNSNDCPTVSGVVENYHPMPYDGHDREHFEIDGVYFEYSDFEITNGYHNAASRGGVITQNGQKLLIKYYYDVKYDRNIILYIEEVE